MTHSLNFPLKRSLLALVSLFALGLASCAQTNTPASSEASQSAAVQADYSRDAADLAATAVGTSSGGSGMVFDDAMTIASGANIPDAVMKPQSDTATIHTATVTRSKTWGNYTYSGTWTHTWEFFDASGNPMPKFIKGQTDKVAITTRGQHTSSTLRVSVDDSSSGTWTISNLIASPNAPTLNGTLTRAGLTTRLLNGKTIQHTFTINWTNDTLIRTDDHDGDGEVTYLLGTGNSDFKAIGPNGGSFDRQVNIVFHGDGTATLNVTRTSGNGKVDTFTIDVKRGLWLRDEHLG